MQLTIDGHTHDVELDSMPFDDACTIEDVTGQTIAEWAADVGRGSAKAMRALAFVLVRRVRPEVRLADIGKLDFADFLTQMLAAGTAAGEAAPAGGPVDPSQASG